MVYKIKKYMSYPTTLEDAEPPADESLLKKIDKKKKLKWERKDERWVEGKKRFSVYIRKEGNLIKEAFLGTRAPNDYEWEVSTHRISDTSWEIAEQGDRIAYRMRRAGSPFSNIFWQKRDKKMF